MKSMNWVMLHAGQRKWVLAWVPIPKVYNHHLGGITHDMKEESLVTGNDRELYEIIIEKFKKSLMGFL